MARTAIENLDILYNRLREQVTTENNLYHQRIVWLITMQAFLFATVGLTLQAKYYETGIRDIFVIDAVFCLIAVTGMLVALISNRLLNGARESLDHLGRTWDDALKYWEVSEDDRRTYPHVKGRDDSGDNKPNWLLRSGNLPLMFFWVWIVFVTIIGASKLLI